QARRPYTTNCLPGVIPAPAGTQYALFAGTTHGPCLPWLGQVLVVGNSDTSNYNAVLVNLQLRAYHGLAPNFNYQYQHCFDIFSGNENIWTLPANSRDPHNDFSGGCGGTPQNITANFNYAIPGRKSFAQMLQGWAVNGVVRILPHRFMSFSDGASDIAGV